MKLILLALIASFMIGCETREIVTENEVPNYILENENYIGRLTEHPDRKPVGMFYYNTKKLHFYICIKQVLWTGKSGAIVYRWKYISLERLKEHL